MKTKTKLKLSNSRKGRIFLHLICLLCHPNHLNWHLHGIIRELVQFEKH